MKSIYLKALKYGYIFVCFFILWGCQSHEEMSSSAPDLSELPDQEGWNSVLTTTNQGRMKARIQFEHMEKYSKKKIVKFNQGVEIDLYDEKGSHTSRVYCDEAVLNETTNQVELSGNVVVVSDSGLTLRSQKLRWNENEGKILSDVFVTIITAEKDTIHGYGFEADQTLKNWIIKRPWGVTQKRLNLEVLEEPRSRKRAND